jgi:DNA modification methylase
MIIWVKNHAVMGRLNYLPMHELILYGWFGTHKFMKSQDKSVLFYPKPNKSKRHPTTKPIGLIRNLILNSTKIGDIVWDGFLGSGTTLLACEQVKRRCFAIELDSEYFLMTIKQWEKLTGLKAKQL